MAVIGRIRKRSGLLVIIVGLALAAFVLGDFLKPGKRYRKNTYVGIVAGENIPYTEFSQKVDEQIENTKQRAQKDKLTADEVFSVRQMTWNQMVRDIIMGKQYDKLGVSVSSDELFDLVQGKNPHQYILQYFKDPNTGQFNPQSVLNFLKNLDKVEPEQKKNWLMLEKAIKDERIQTKYNNLISKAYYFPKVLVQQDYMEKNKRYDVRLVAIPYQTIEDKTITLSEEDYKKYYEENKMMYEQEASRDINYVTFELLPSDADLKSITEDVTRTYEDFQKATDAPAFVIGNSDGKYDSSWQKEKTLPARIDSVLFNAAIGTFVPPFIDDNKYKMAKLLEVQLRPDSMMASHILISYQGSAANDSKITRSKDKAKQVADSLMQVLKANPMMFPVIAGQISDDASNKNKGGDLGWFTDGTMVKPFNDAVVEGFIGELKLVETVFGYHLINITNKKAPLKKIKVAIVERRIEPSPKTINDIYSKAGEFAGSNNTVEAFDKACETKGYNKRVAEQVKAMDNALPGLPGSRGIVQWAFLDETKKGTVSTVFEIEGYYVVAALKDAREKGIPTLEQLKPTIEPLVKRDKKAEKIMADLKKAPITDLYQLAASMKSKVDTVENIVFFSGNMPKFGPEPEVVGTISTMKLNTISAPVKGAMGVYVVRLDTIVEPPALQDFKMAAMQASYGFTNRVQGQVYQILEKMAKLEDNRVRFF